ncbi:SHOCT domain-containing protein [Halobaculum marinum]|uniref:SHOCT domain-containing protein n=1 Tax=Halobaculum marinum TaxID=3031996 RepID=A0ABD5X299_9EURY|nr:SHOCT domain-containing protein [Halobaculum sp. DT55]
MSDDDSRLVTGTMLGLFLAFGVDVIVIVGALWYVGEVAGSTAGRVTAAILAAFSLWVVGRWVRLRRADGTDDAADTASGEADADPVERLKRRYADGEVSDEEFERRIDRLLDADSRFEAGEVDGNEAGDRLRESE